MQRLVTFLALSLSFAGIAAAHTLDTDQGPVAQLWHQVLGAHHLPITILLLAVGIAAFRWRRRALSTIERGRR